MKTLFKTLFILLLSLPAVYANSVGLALGNPTGLNGQYTLAADQVLDLTLGAELAQGEFEGILNYYHKKEDHFYLSSYPMDFFYGGGFKIKDGFGVNGSLSAAHQIQGQRLEPFGAIGATIYAFGKEGAELDAYLGIRYLF